MLFFSLIVLAILTVVFANPIPEDIEDSNYLNIGTDPTYNPTYNPSDTVNIEASSNVPPNVDTVADSVIISESEPRCITDASVDDQIDNGIQKRSQKTYCPILVNGGAKVPIPQTTTEQPAGDTRTTTKDPSKCPKPELPDYVACGGSEVTDATVFPLLGAVLNCVPGGGTSIEARGSFAAVGADQLVKYCCQKYGGHDPLYPAYVCEKLTPGAKRPQMLYYDMETLLQQLIKKGIQDRGDTYQIYKDNERRYRENRGRRNPE